MTTPFSFNEVCALAAAIDAMEDEDISVLVDGEMNVDDHWLPLGDGEASRLIVYKVIDHPVVKTRLAESDKLWDALRWLVDNAQFVRPPNSVRPIIAAAVTASIVDGGSNP